MPLKTDSKNVLIFGAGLNQVTLIKACNELGHRSIVVDPNDDALGKEYADVYCIVAPNDYGKTNDIAKKYQIHGIVTSQMENPLKIMARLAQEMGYVFHSPETVERCTNKYLMKQAFVKNNVPCAKGKHFSKTDEITQEAIDGLIYPLILKPVQAHSSKGVYKIEVFCEFEKFVRSTRSFSHNGSFLIEEFLDGPEYSVEAITYQSRTSIIQYTEKFVSPFPYTVEMGHLQPADLTAQQRDNIDKIVKDGLNALGIDNSASHSEVKLTAEGPKLVEIGARGGGDFISSHLAFASTGVNMDKAIINVALGNKPDLLHKLVHHSYIKYIELPVGSKVIAVSDYLDICERDGVVFAHLGVESGDVVEEITESKKRPGFIIVAGDSRKDVLEKASFYEKKLLEKVILGDA